MAEVFARTETVFFVGGPRTGTQAGGTLSGGCTKAFFDANGGEDSFDLLSIMGANGEPIDTAGGAAVTLSGGNTLIAKVGAFTNTIVGMVVFVSGTSLNDGRYEVLIRTDDAIEISGDAYVVDSNTLVVNVGGAFDSISSVDGNVDAAEGSTTTAYHSVRVYDNKNITLSNSEVTISAGGGSVVHNTFLSFTGFNSVPGDMMFGGDFYQSPFDAHMNGIDETKCVVVDANNSMAGTKHNIVISTPNVIMHNFYCKNNNTGTSFTISSNYVSLINCKSSDNSHTTSGNSVNFTGTLGEFMFSFYVKNMGTNIITCSGEIYLLNSIIDHRATPVSSSAVASTDLSSIFENNLIIGGTRGITAFGTSESIRNNTFYGQTLLVLRLRSATDSKYITGNIIVADPAAYALNVQSGGCNCLNDYNCIFGTDGSPLPHPFRSLQTGGTEPTLGKNSIEADPLFVDAAGGDVRLLPTSPCINTGDMDAQDGYNSMGCWLPESKLIKNNWGGPNGWLSSFKH